MVKTKDGEIVNIKVHKSTKDLLLVVKAQMKFKSIEDLLLNYYQIGEDAANVKSN